MGGRRVDFFFRVGGRHVDSENAELAGTSNAELAGTPNAELAGIPNAVGVMTLSKKGECPNPLKIFAPNY